MTRRSEQNGKGRLKLQNLVVVTLLDDIDRAREYESLLKSDQIPAMIKEHYEGTSDGGATIAIMVPEDFLDEAHVVIESQQDYEDFYNFDFDDEYNDSFDTEFFDEEF